MRRLFCQLLACLGLWLFAGPVSAAAASADADVAPMCDPTGASVAAREDIPEIDRANFEALPCEAQLLMAGWRPGSPEFCQKALHLDDREGPAPRPLDAMRPRYEAAREGAFPFPGRIEPTLAAGDRAEGLAACRGHVRASFRPPVIRA